MAPSSPRLPGSCTWNLQWPAFGAILNAQFNASKWLPGLFGLDWGWAGPGRPTGVSQGCPAPLPLQGHPVRPPWGENVTTYEFSGGPQCAKI